MLNIITIIISNVLITVTILCPKTLQGYRTQLDKKTNKRTEALTVSSRGQTTYCAVQSRSPSHCQTKTEKVQSLARDGTLSATMEFLTDGCGCDRRHRTLSAVGLVIRS